MIKASWPQFWGCIVLIFLIGFGAGKMSNPTEETTKSTSSVASSDQTMAASTEKKSGSNESEKSKYVSRTYYPNGQLKSEVEKSVEMLKTKYEQEISDLKIQIKMLESKATFEHTVKFDCPMNSIGGFGGASGEKVAIYERQLFKNVSIGGGGYQMPACGSGLLVGGRFSF